MEFNEIYKEIAEVNFTIFGIIGFMMFLVSIIIEGKISEFTFEVIGISLGLVWLSFPATILISYLRSKNDSNNSR